MLRRAWVEVRLDPGAMTNWSYAEAGADRDREPSVDRPARWRRVRRLGAHTAVRTGIAAGADRDLPGRPADVRVDRHATPRPVHERTAQARCLALVPGREGDHRPSRPVRPGRMERPASQVTDLDLPGTV